MRLKVQPQNKDGGNPSFQLVEKVLYLMWFYYILLTFIYRGKLPIVLFVGQHFSGSLFHLITLLLFTRETTKGIRESLSLAYARLVRSAKAPLDCRSEAKRND